jgi:hypothetical protein
VKEGVNIRYIADDIKRHRQFRLVAGFAILVISVLTAAVSKVPGESQRSEMPVTSMGVSAQS